MRKIPLWKLWREIVRPFRQARVVLPNVATYMFGSRYNDIFIDRRKRIFPGMTSATSQVSIFVIFPTLGVQEAALRTLEYLADKGFSTIVVSNLELSDGDRRKITERCWRYIERPNFGYDFGAYRAGILSLGTGLFFLERLLLLNDSVWFPLSSRSDWIDASTGMRADFVGAVSNYGIDRKAVSDFENGDWNYSSDHRSFHYCSFALMIGRRPLADRRFLRFWKTFPLTSDKNRTVRRGEIGLTGWMLRHGYSHAETLNVADLQSALNNLPTRRLAEVASELVVPEAPYLLREKHALLDRAEPPTRRALVGLILRVVAEQGAAYTIPAFSTEELGFQFLKKSPLWLDRESSDITLRLAERIDGRVGTEIFTEAKALRRAKAPEFDTPPPLTPDA